MFVRPQQKSLRIHKTFKPSLMLEKKNKQPQACKLQSLDLTKDRAVPQDESQGQVWDQVSISEPILVVLHKVSRSGNTRPTLCCQAFTSAIQPE